MSGFPVRDEQSLAFPVKIVEGERCYFSGPQTVRNEQEQDRIVSPT
jgi:hypothetical protein